jgi:hypothetical protein
MKAKYVYAFENWVSVSFQIHLVSIINIMQVPSVLKVCSFPFSPPSSRKGKKMYITAHYIWLHTQIHSHKIVHCKDKVAPVLN